MAKRNTEETSTNVDKEKDTNTVKPTSNGSVAPSYEELLQMVTALATEVQQLKEPHKDSTPPSTDLGDLLSALVNRKSDQEVVIVHNMEMNGGLTTHIELSTITIDFTRLGEQRVLSWQQFEECVSKYRSFFERKILLLGAEEAELAKKYSVPCVEDQKNLLTTADIQKLPSLTSRELEDFIEKLSESDKSMILSYWLGKCYEKDPRFYDRYKIDLLNRLTGKQNVFKPILDILDAEQYEK